MNAKSAGLHAIGTGKYRPAVLPQVGSVVAVARATFLALGCVTLVCAFEPLCLAFEAPKTIQGDPSTLHHHRFLWTITADLDGNVVVENSRLHTRCKTVLGSVVSTYVGDGNLVYLRSQEIASDELFTLDGRNCREARKVKALDVQSERKSIAILRANGLCTSQ